MSTTTTTIQLPGSGLLAKWADVFGELQAVAEKLKSIRPLADGFGDIISSRRPQPLEWRIANLI